MNETSYPKDKIKVLLLEGINDSAIETFKKSDYINVERLNTALSEDDLIDRLQDVHILGIRSKTQVTAKVIENAPKLMAVGAFCIGTNQIDLGAATEAGVTVFNSPFSNTRSVAELIIAYSVLLIRRIPERDRAIHRGEWLKDYKGSHELRGKTLGIVGYGRIGSQVSVLAEGLGLHVIYYDVEPKLPLGNAHQSVDLEELLRESDIVSLHVPSTELTANLITAEEIGQMKEGGIIINYSRGNVVDIDALRSALESGHLKGAAIDVFPEEPKSKDEPFKSPLQGLQNVILTPHIGGSTVEAQVNIGMDVATKMINLLDTGSTMGSCSIPALALPVQDNVHRLLHIHENKPGVLSEINSMLSMSDLNVEGQYLKTNEKIGYVVVDIATDDPDAALDKLRQVKHTIKARILY